MVSKVINHERRHDSPSKRQKPYIPVTRLPHQRQQAKNYQEAKNSRVDQRLKEKVMGVVIR